MLGLNDSINRSSPVQLGALTNWNLVSTANYTSSAIKSDGTLWSWGYNFAGHLGHNDTIDRSSPVQVGSSTDWSKVCVAAFSMASIKTDGTLWSWGLNSNGQLGLGDIVYRSSPTQVGSDTTWNNLPDQMKTNNSGRWMLATKANGTLWSWGQGNNGKLGLNSEIDRSSPTQVGTGTTWDKVSGGNGSSMAIKTDGTLWAWGSNAYSSLGKLGLNDTNYRSSPTQVGTDTNWSLVSVGHYSAAAIRTNGTLWSWGNNAKGELGLGDKVNKSSPTQVGSDTNWVSLSMGQKTLMAIKEV
jgi:alpha-tubulin suppressor-like RCC1 family protein